MSNDNFGNSQISSNYESVPSSAQGYKMPPRPKKAKKLFKDIMMSSRLPGNIPGIKSTLKPTTTRNENKKALFEITDKKQPKSDTKKQNMVQQSQ